MFVAQFLLCLALECKVLQEEEPTQFKEQAECLSYAKELAVGLYKQYSLLATKVAFKCEKITIGVDV
jgi:hypothetical protein